MTLPITPAGVRIEGVDLSYGANQVLNKIDLEIAPGELFAFLGPSGCGKTTLLRLIAGFARADSGRVLIGGSDVSAQPPWQRDVGLVFQNYALWPHMTVAQNVAFGLEERRLPRAEIAARVAEALALVGLGDLAGRRPAQLSGGQQQRVALARTLVIRPKVLLLDEPLSNLDAQLRVQVRRELRELQQRLGLTAIFVTHDQEEANTIADRIAVMNSGTVQQVGPPMELYQRPANLFVAGFLGAANILAGRCVEEGGNFWFELGEGSRIQLAGNCVDAAASRLVFRPHDVALRPHGPLSPVGTAELHGTVRDSEFLGPSVRYTVRLGDDEVRVDVPFGSAEQLFRLGDAVRVAIDTARAVMLSQ